jgi:hypothetical protein
MTQLAIDIPQVTVRVLKAQRTLAGDAVEADRIDGVASGDMPRLLVFWREEGEDVSGGSGPPAFAMELTLVVQALVERAARCPARRSIRTTCGPCAARLPGAARGDGGGAARADVPVSVSRFCATVA